MAGWSQMWLGPFGSVQQSAEPALKGLTSAQQEAMALAARRTQAWLELPTKIVGCKGPQDVVATSTAFWQSAASDWQETSRRLMSAWGAAVPAFGAAVQAATQARDHIVFSDPVESKRSTERSETGSRRAA